MMEKVNKVTLVGIEGIRSIRVWLLLSVECDVGMLVKRMRRHGHFRDGGLGMVVCNS